MKRCKFLDLVIAGPDMSGTSTQVKDIITYLQSKDLDVRDIRGTEIDALFHSQKLQYMIRNDSGEYLNLNGFLTELESYEKLGASLTGPKEFLSYANTLLSGGGTNQDLKIASMVENNVTTYINPSSADAWIMEEPTKRGAGQVNRVIEQNRSQFGDSMNPYAAALSHQVYRTDEFLRFRKPLRDNNKIIVRSRSEESACYQIYDEKSLPNGIKMKEYLKLPGHEIAFRNAPTDIFVVSGPDNWTEKDYLKLKKERSDGRSVDDHESNAGYQVMVNHRYATDWVEKLYEKGCSIHGGTPPKITRFNIYDSMPEIKSQMEGRLESLI